MIPAVRQEKILEMLSGDNIITTDEIMAVINVSPSTLRRDLIKLEEIGKINLLHGGGVRLAEKTVELSINVKLKLNRELKEKIGKKAADIVEDGDVIFLDPSSTTYMMIPYLAGRRVTVVTNGIPHINQCAYYNIPTIVVGGSIKKTTNSCIGPIAESTLSDLHFNKSFLGANGYSLEAGITNHDVNEKAIKLIAIKNSIKPYFLIDSTKYGIVTLTSIGDVRDYTIITDDVPNELKKFTNFIQC